MASLIDQLLQSDEPSIRLQIRLGVQDADEAEANDLRQRCSSARVATLLSERGPDGVIDAPTATGRSGTARIGCW